MVSSLRLENKLLDLSALQVLLLVYQLLQLIFANSLFSVTAFVVSNVDCKKSKQIKKLKLASLIVNTPVYNIDLFIYTSQT